MLYMVRCILELKTPLHCGETTDGILDAPVTRDPFGYWRIPGSTIAGVMRSYVHDNDPEHEVILFGQEQGQEQSSHVWCSDAVLLDYDQTPAWRKAFLGQPVNIGIHSFLRDHVCMDLEKGVGTTGGKFDEEYVPAGTRFALEISLDGWMEPLTPDMISAFTNLLLVFKNESLHFGAFASNGYGSYKIVAFEARQFNLTDPQGMEQWLQLTEMPLFPKGLGTPWEVKGTCKTPNKNILCGNLTIPLKATGPILIAGGSPKGNIDADLCFVQTAMFDYTKKQLQDVLVLPGSSLRGILRHRVYQILTAQGVASPQKEIDDLFGATKGGTDMHRGRLGVSDARLLTVNDQAVLDDCQSVQHVSIDRFTGGAMDAHLFNEAPLWQEDVSFQLHIRLDAVTPKQASLLLHALLDLMQGKLAVGNGVNRGNGRVALDAKTPIKCNLAWNGEELTETDHAKAKQWLAKIAQA